MSLASACRVHSKGMLVFTASWVYDAMPSAWWGANINYSAAAATSNIHAPVCCMFMCSVFICSACVIM